jgi:hypothetical protein
MVDNDYNMVKPVGGLQNIRNITAAKRREERKRRQNSRAKQGENAEQQPSDLVDQDKRSDESTEGENGHHAIDYCA